MFGYHASVIVCVKKLDPALLCLYYFFLQVYSASQCQILKILSNSQNFEIKILAIIC